MPLRESWPVTFSQSKIAVQHVDTQLKEFGGKAKPKKPIRQHRVGHTRRVCTALSYVMAICRPPPTPKRRTPVSAERQGCAGWRGEGAYPFRLQGRPRNVVDRPFAAVDQERVLHRLGGVPKVPHQGMAVIACGKAARGGERTRAATCSQRLELRQGLKNGHVLAVHSWCLMCGAHVKLLIGPEWPFSSYSDCAGTYSGINGPCPRDRGQPWLGRASTGLAHALSRALSHALIHAPYPAPYLTPYLTP